GFDVALAVDLQYARVSEEHAPRTPRVHHQRRAPCLRAGPSQRLARIDALPGICAVRAAEEAAPAQPGEQRPARILPHSQHAGSRKPASRQHEAVATVDRSDDVRLELGSCVDRLPIAAIDDDAREYAVEQTRLRQELEVVT